MAVIMSAIISGMIFAVSKNMEKSKYVFIDESGTPDLGIEKGGVSQYFIYAAVVIEDDEIENARVVLNTIYDKYYKQNRYLKSSHIPNDDSGYIRTINILTELKSLKHFVYVIVVDKSKINDSSGLSYKTVFVKYFNRLIAEHIGSIESDIHIVFDKTGYYEFQQELILYMEEKGWGPNLFSNNTYDLLDDRTEEPLLQLADFYAGTISKYYCGKFDEKRSNVIHDGFIKKNVSIEWFPHNNVPMFAVTAGFDNNYNEIITKIAIDSAEKYLDNYANDTIGCELILYILQETQRTPFRYISSKEIKTNLRARNVEIGDPIVKISELRDKGVLIISPIGKKGYKIPNNELEIAEFYNRLNGNILPQLRRCQILNNVLLEQSNGTYNILSSSEFEVLSRLCDVIFKK